MTPTDEDVLFAKNTLGMLPDLGTRFVSCSKYSMPCCVNMFRINKFRAMPCHNTSCPCVRAMSRPPWKTMRVTLITEYNCNTCRPLQPSGIGSNSHAKLNHYLYQLLEEPPVEFRGLPNMVTLHEHLETFPEESLWKNITGDQHFVSFALLDFCFVVSVCVAGTEQYSAEYLY